MKKAKDDEREGVGLKDYIDEGSGQNKFRKKKKRLRIFNTFFVFVREKQRKKLINKK